PRRRSARECRQTYRRKRTDRNRRSRHSLRNQQPAAGRLLDIRHGSETTVDRQLSHRVRFVLSEANQRHLSSKTRIATGARARLSLLEKQVLSCGGMAEILR